MADTLKQQQMQAAFRITLLGSVLDLVLGVLKILIGLAANSVALVADGIHSLSDLVTDGFVLIVTRMSSAEPDREHPYGHRRFETLGTIALGIVLFGVACVICYDSLRRLSHPEQLPIPGWPGLVIATLSIAGKEWAYRFTRRVALEINSSLLMANAWHSRTDAFSSVAVLIGILGAIAGFPAMDVLAAVFVALMIAKIAWDLVGSSLSELVDTALPAEKVEAIRDHVRNMEGIRDSHELRTRLHGGEIFVDLHVQVGDRITVSEGHHLGDTISSSLKKKFPEISDVVVHIDPEPDFSEAPNLELPLRAEVESILAARWTGLLGKDAIKRVQLHYLQNHIEADVYLNISLINSILADNLNKELEDLEWLEKVNYYGTL